MFPIVRLIKEFVVHRNAPDLPGIGTHISHHRCWPQDLDMFLEMNNGRILTILDLGRFVLAKRVGLVAAMRRNGWGLTVAGSSVMYRKRIRPLVRFRIESRAIGWDDKFFYIMQSIWIGDICAVQALFRTALTDKNGIVKPKRAFADVGFDEVPPELPMWVQNWIAAEKTRPWPPERMG
ncbi:acyl-CoA thioesterase [Yoonia sediminilitoris]|uniref:Acyl-CoA thioesterase FadM n=1 Tax=Yoonia sediminilitoris TaxID=1286148 RepID=A0A2T6K9W5_9RHOB|nr:acyl-CoA thioesterase [Yoonia sediminilitoris]PUB11570.1 acyl-CoA thioesterase FadM [Yoonia sediminilitoris]RCW91770.1 acyl-CoA thioesterase FadM [Yoonia sediminilitoris]